MKVLNYKLCSSAIKEEKIQNKNKALELGLPFKEGLILEIKRLKRYSLASFGKMCLNTGWGESSTVFTRKGRDSQMI